MILDAPKTANSIRSHRFQAGLWVGASLLVGLFAVVGLALVLVGLVNPESPPLVPTDYVLYPCCFVFAVILPGGSAALSALQAMREVRRADAQAAMLSCMRPDGTFDREEHTRLIGKARSDQAYIDALARGTLRMDAKPSVREASQPFQIPQTAGLGHPGASPHGPTRHSPAHAPLMPHSPAPISHSPAPISHSPAPMSHSPTPMSHAPSPMAHTAAAFAQTSYAPTPQPPQPSVRPVTGPMSHAPSPRPDAFPATSGPPPEVTMRPAERASAEQLVGRTLKQTYFVEALLAAGGMGCVYTARHVRTGRRYAVKTLLPDERISVESLQRFEREARTASSLGHAGIVQVHDFELESDPRYLVMDLLVGETLEHRLARIGRLQWGEVKKLALEVAEALHAAHTAGVLHRDLKPSNVFLATREGLGERAILLDFGLAKPIREGASVWVTRTGAIVGTAHYMSPEQARGERTIDIRSDVYGLAALLYETIAGVPPFLGASPFAVLTSLLTEQPVPPSHLMQGVPPALDALLLRALAKSPNERPKDVLAFAQELHAIP